MVWPRLQRVLTIPVLTAVIVLVVYLQLSLKEVNTSRYRHQSGQEPTTLQTTTRETPEETHPVTETRHLFFLKVHKAASTTVQNLLFRFAVRRHLLVLLPQPQHANILHEWSKAWLPMAIPLPPAASHFDILCNHLVFDEDNVRKVLPRDTIFVAILRNPFQQFLSAFWFYREVFGVRYLRKVRGDRPVSKYLKNPIRYEVKARGRSFTHNRMSLDFGMNPGEMHEERYVQSYITYLNTTFHLVMISERFDESVILLKRLLGWKIEDVLYLQNNAFRNEHFDQNFTQRERFTHRVFNMADYRLYEHFARVFDDKVRAAGDGFPAEVKAFRGLLGRVKNYCQTPGGPEHAVKMTAAFWDEEILLTSEVCYLMGLGEQEFVKLMRKSNSAVLHRKKELGWMGG